MVASAKYMFGEIGTTLISATLETRATHVTEYMAYFLDSIRNTEQQITLIDFFALDTLQESTFAKPKTNIGNWLPSFFLKAFINVISTNSQSLIDLRDLKANDIIQKKIRNGYC